MWTPDGSQVKLSLVFILEQHDNILQTVPVLNSVEMLRDSLDHYKDCTRVCKTGRAGRNIVEGLNIEHRQWERRKVSERGFIS